MNILTLADLGEKGQMRVVSENPGLVDELHNAPLVLKVAHHGSADCYPELYEALQARVALISVGKNNGYGHPTKTALDALAYSGSAIERTDLLGSIAVSNAGSDLAVTVGGGE